MHSILIMHSYVDGHLGEFQFLAHESSSQWKAMEDYGYRHSVFFLNAQQITSYTSFTYPPTLLDVPITTLPEETPSLTPWKYLTQAEK